MDAAALSKLLSSAAASSTSAAANAALALPSFFNAFSVASMRAFSTSKSISRLAYSAFVNAASAFARASAATWLACDLRERCVDEALLDFDDDVDVAGACGDDAGDVGDGEGDGDDDDGVDGECCGDVST